MIDRDVEELLEALYTWQIEHTGSQPQATAEVIEMAVSMGLVTIQDGRPRLTDGGIPAAGDVVRRHRLAERLLRDVLGVQREDAMEADACLFEHLLLHGLDTKVCILLGHPATCPHGKPIPPGPCCRTARQDAISEVGPLSEGDVGRDGVVAYLSTRQRREVQKLMAMGVLPGTDIRLLQRFPSYVFQLGYSQFTVDRSLAELIYVHWRDVPSPAPGGARHRHGAGHDNEHGADAP